jgi:mono/diheme cytochrome c family protein
MKKLAIITGFVALAGGIVGCGGAHGNDPGQSYMPDMYYARAYETYGYNNVEGEYDSLKRRGIFYNAMPVPGTVARGESLPYHLTGDSTGLVAAEAMKSPFDTTAVNGTSLKEAERLFLVNCGICHGPALDGNGPIAVTGAYPAVPPSLKDAKATAFSDGHFFHVITFGKGSMGSYASQLTPEQRWWVIKYIRSKQVAGATKPQTGDSTDKAPANIATGGVPVVGKDANK